MPMRRVFITLLLAISIILSSGCAATAVPAASPTNPPTRTAPPTQTASPAPTITASLPPTSPPRPTATRLPTATPQPADFIRAKGSQLVQGPLERVIYLRGINFSNYNWASGAEILASNHHTRADYARVAGMGMNVIRFCLSYRIFESDEQPYTYSKQGWAWLDQQVAWAKESGLYLILNLHVPPGADTEPEGGKIWSDPALQARTVALWQAIARRYRAEPAIAGYDLINEPMTEEKTWQPFAARIAAAIREVDDRHLLVVEGALGGPAIDSFIDDGNVMYDFHFYQPHQFSHGPKIGQASGVYPNDRKIEIPNWDDLQGTEYFRNPRLEAGTSDWTFYEGVKYTARDRSTKIGIPAMLCEGNRGTAYFSDFTVHEWDADGKDLGDIVSVRFDRQPFWGVWSSDGKAGFGQAQDCTPQTCGSRAAVHIVWAAHPATISDPFYAFDAVPGHTYQLSGWMKGDDISQGAACSLNIEFNRTKSGLPLWHRNKTYLEHQILAAAKLGLERGVPINVGEFGSFYTNYTSGAGGQQWVADVMDILLQNHFNFQFWAYHDEFGIYPSYNAAPADQPPVPGLIELFSRTLKFFP